MLIEYGEAYGFQIDGNLAFGVVLAKITTCDDNGESTKIKMMKHSAYCARVVYVDPDDILFRSGDYGVPYMIRDLPAAKWSREEAERLTNELQRHANEKLAQTSETAEPE